MTPDMQQTLTERRHLIETRAEAILDTALHTHEPWVTAFGPIPADGRERQQWRRRAVVVAAYRDRYQITGSAPGRRARRRRSTAPGPKQRSGRWPVRPSRTSVGAPPPRRLGTSTCNPPMAGAHEEGVSPRPEDGARPHKSADRATEIAPPDQSLVPRTTLPWNFLGYGVASIVQNRPCGPKQHRSCDTYMRISSV